MTRTCVRYRCDACGFESAKWLGRCPECDAWGSCAEPPAANRPEGPAAVPGTVAVPIAAVDALGAAQLPTGAPELDRVLGGGPVAGSAAPLGGGARVGRCLPVGAEESPAQVRVRADRLGTLVPELLVVGENSLPAVVAHVGALAPVVVGVAPIQTAQPP